MKWFSCIMLTLAVLLPLTGVSGQSKMKFSVHADPQFAWFSSDDDSISPDGSILQIQAGLQMDYYFEKNYAIILGFGINNLGGNLLYTKAEDYLSYGDTITLGPGQKVKMNLQYLDIPIGLKLKTEELGYATFFLQLGFNPMFNINAHVTDKDGPLDKENIQESVHVFNLGYHVGAGAEYRLGGSTALLGSIRWSSGLTNVTDMDGARISINAISINLGILF